MLHREAFTAKVKWIESINRPWALPPSINSKPAQNSVDEHVGKGMKVPILIRERKRGVDYI